MAYSFGRVLYKTLSAASALYGNMNGNFLPDLQHFIPNADGPAFEQM